MSISDIEQLGERFDRFAGEARTYAGRLYAALSREIARDPELLAIARHVRRPPVPNVLFASVHFLLACSLCAFLFTHVYLATLGSSPLAYFKPMLTGWEEVEHGHEESHGDSRDQGKIHQH